MAVTEDSRQRARHVVEAAESAIVRIGRHGGRGGGFVADQGIVVTNAHNLRDRTTEVTFADGRAVQGRAVGVDLDGDLVVLEVDTGAATPLEWATEQSELGDPVYAVVPAGDGPRLTIGTVSGVERSFRGPRGRRISGALEHTAPLARGSSGSPILDQDGRVVGISTRRLGDGFYLAMAANDELRSRVDRLRAGETPSRRFLGVALTPVHVGRRLRRAVGLPERDGVLISQVESDSPADRAGLQKGDLITAVGDTEVASVDAVIAQIDAVPDNGSLLLHVVRGTDEVDIRVSFEASDGDKADHGEA